MALLAGFLGGMLGIGGGMIINPLLIEIGMHPQVCFAPFHAFPSKFLQSQLILFYWYQGQAGGQSSFPTSKFLSILNFCSVCFSTVVVDVQLTAATTAFMVFFSSSLSVVQFWILGRLPLDFALLFAGICFLFSLIGLRVVQQAISKFGRPSVIVFSVSIVLGFSAVLTTIFGGLNVWNQYARGEYMGFHNPC